MSKHGKIIEEYYLHSHLHENFKSHGKIIVLVYVLIFSILESTQDGKDIWSEWYCDKITWCVARQQVNNKYC